MKKYLLSGVIAIAILSQGCAVVQKCAVKSSYEAGDGNVEVCVECKGLTQAEKDFLKQKSKKEVELKVVK